MTSTVTESQSRLWLQSETHLVTLTVSHNHGQVRIVATVAVIVTITVTESQSRLHLQSEPQVIAILVTVSQNHGQVRIAVSRSHSQSRSHRVAFAVAFTVRAAASRNNIQV